MEMSGHGREKMDTRGCEERMRRVGKRKASENWDHKDSLAKG